MIASFLFAVLLTSPSVLAEDFPVTCPSIPEIPSLACIATKNGWFYAASAETATQVAHDGAEAIAAFRRYLGQEAPFGATVLADHFPKTEQDNFAKRHSLAYLQFWVPQESKAAVIEESIRRSMPEMPDSQVRALAQRVIQGTGSTSVLRHEIGHSLYWRVFWPQHVADGEIYGTPAPDWLDEASATLLEPEAMLTERRAEFWKLIQENSTLVRPLSEFLSARHPIGTANQRAQLGASRERAVELAHFYTQSLAVAEFLIERSGKKDLLGDISMALASGDTFDAWLALHGKEYGLGTDLTELDREWGDWLDSQPEPTVE